MNEIVICKAENARLKSLIAAIHNRLAYGPRFTEATKLTIIDECEKEIPLLKNYGMVPNAELTGVPLESTVMQED